MSLVLQTPGQQVKSSWAHFPASESRGDLLEVAKPRKNTGERAGPVAQEPESFQRNVDSFPRICLLSSRMTWRTELHSCREPALPEAVRLSGALCSHPHCSAEIISRWPKFSANRWLKRKKTQYLHCSSI